VPFKSEGRERKEGKTLRSQMILFLIFFFATGFFIQIVCMFGDTEKRIYILMIDDFVQIYIFSSLFTVDGLRLSSLDLTLTHSLFCCVARISSLTHFFSFLLFFLRLLMDREKVFCHFYGEK
jgi:hypothetical protein